MTNTANVATDRNICQRTFAFALRIVRLCQSLDKSPGLSRTLGRQLLRSGTSIGANVTEAQSGQSKKDFISKMCIACKEARETHYWLRLLCESGIVREGLMEEIMGECNELIAILTSIIKNARAGCQ